MKGIFKNDDPTATISRENNFCSPVCVKKYIDGKVLCEDEYIYGSIPLDKLEMCQFCGNFTHPTEYCRETEQREGMDIMGDVSIHQQIENKTGEWAIAKGEILCLKYGVNIQVDYESIVVSTTMNKLPANMEDRAPLLVFWYSEETCNDILKEMNITERVEVEKEIFTDIRLYKNVSKKQTDASKVHVLYRVERIKNPHKLYFPFDIRQENCWWPTNQKTFGRTSSIILTSEYEKDWSHMMEYDKDEIIEEEKEQDLEEKMGTLTL